MIILKFTENQGFTFSLEDTFLEKQRQVVKLTPPQLSAFYGLMKTQNLPTIVVQQFKQRLMMKNHTIESISKHKILSPKVD